MNFCTQLFIRVCAGRETVTINTCAAYMLGSNDQCVSYKIYERRRQLLI
jgi:hypothetical protein